MNEPNDAVAEIALSLPDNPTSAQIIGAVQRGFDAGTDYMRSLLADPHTRNRRIIEEVLKL